MIYIAALLIGVLGGFCAFSKGSFFQKISGQVFIMLIFFSEIAIAIYAYLSGGSGIISFVLSFFVGSYLGNKLFYYIYNGGILYNVPTLPYKLIQLQCKIASNNNMYDGAVNVEKIFKSWKAQDDIIDIYVDYCCKKQLYSLCVAEQITKNDLKEIYTNLCKCGAGQYVGDGHYVALSAISFPETVAYYLTSKKNKVNDMEICYKLLEYFRGRIKLAPL
jgi:hypothetical protein